MFLGGKRGRKGSQEMGWHDRRRPLFFLCLALLSFMSTATLVDGQSGFLNIDCGKANGYSYNDSRTGLVYTSDYQYVSTGETSTVTSSNQDNSSNQLNDLRSFPFSIRSCYTLPAKPGRKYLVRAWFRYGNYDGLGKPPQFELHAGVNFWSRVIFIDATITRFHELIFVAGAKRSFDICLVNTGDGTPFISALELRPLPDELYPQVNTSQALWLVERTDDGNSNQLRYPNDIYDRIWSSFSPDRSTTISTPFKVESVPGYQPPSDVLSSAFYRPNASAMSFASQLVTDKMFGTQAYVFFHFAELQQLKPNEFREFTITLNDKPWGDVNPVKPEYLKGLTVYNTKPVNSYPLVFNLVGTGKSTLPPIVNAIEVYIVNSMTGAETAQQDVDSIKVVKESYKIQRNWEGDPCSPRKFIWEGLNCSFIQSRSLRIISMNMTSIGLSGEINDAIGNLTELQSLDLSKNSLTGRIPDFLANLTQLKFLDISGNQLHGPIPKALLDRSTSGALTLKVGNKIELCNHSSSCNNRKKSTNKIIAISSSFGSILIFGCVFTIFMWRKKVKNSRKVQIEDITGVQIEHKSSSIDMALLDVDSKQFTYADLVRYTNNFQKEIGRGGFGPVYHGVLDDGKEVAVKLLSKSSSQGPKEFQNEALLLTRIHHKNLVALVGYCNDDINNLALVYEYMVEGSLKGHLQGRGRNASNIMNWMTRLRIAIEAAQGLEYLHHYCNPTIVHRDVKTSNILLDKKFEVKIADFGLSRILEIDNNSHISTKVMGTPGYIDPEYYLKNKLTDRSDVYSFGVVLLEMITGLQPILIQNDDISLVHWVRQRFEEGNLEDLIDKKLQGGHDMSSILKAVEIGLACTLQVSNERPNMTEVVNLLKDCFELEIDKASGHVSRNGIPDININTSIEELTLNMTTISYPSAR